MKGDFSSWRFNPGDNYAGLLHQQGRVSLDADLTEAELIDQHWQEQAGRDVIGAGVAAVPAAESDGFKIVSATVAGDELQLAVLPGRIWADGLLAWLADDAAAPLIRTASYLPPPFNDPLPSVDSIDDDVRDAVVLEVSLEELNGFQAPSRLIEPALGGPDTAERLHLRTEFRVLRLREDEDCHNIAARLADDPSTRGRLSVSLQPTAVVAGDCPLVAGGGYSGFEHNLYRVEIAATNDASARFKWSQFNGGLVGRGEFDAAVVPRRCTLTAGRSAIVNSGLAEFYLEALQYDAQAGAWCVVYGAPAHLNSDHDLELTDPPVFGGFPASSDSLFIRLWNGLRAVAEFPAADTVELRDGIRLAFDAPASGAFRPGDYWTFSLRAGEIRNEQVLLDQRPPAGPRYHRVPLAEIEWTGRRNTAISGTIEDCRRRFRPLSNQKLCCTFLIGDGKSSFGDFNSLEEAALHLPKSGGELCLLPGTHFANLRLEETVNVTVHGCPQRSVLLPRPRNSDDPIIHVIGGSGFRLYDVDLISVRGEAVVIEGGESRPVRDALVRDCRVLAGLCGVRVRAAEDVQVARNRLWLLDTPQGRAAISVQATDALIERNALGVWPLEARPPRDPRDPDDRPDPADPCLKADVFYAQIPHLLGYSRQVWTRALRLQPLQPYRAWGGIHLRGACAKVQVLENSVDGGAGHGVTLGGLLPGETIAAAPDEPAAPTVNIDRGYFNGVTQDGNNQPIADVDVFLSANATPVAQDRSDAQGQFLIKLAPGSYAVSVSPGWRIVEVRQGQGQGPLGQFYVLELLRVREQKSADTGFLYAIGIERNEIQRMGLSGIGFRRYADARERPRPAIADAQAAVEFLSSWLTPQELVGTTNLVRDLVIRGNRLHHNLRARLDDTLQRELQSIGQGGISLALVESAAIDANLIHDNGGALPTCGIFVAAGEDLQISANRITANGVGDARAERAPEEGIRSGIFVRFASAFVAGGEADAQQKPALRVEDNRVDQPVGRALTAFAFGPVSCVGNFLNSEHAGRWSVVDGLVGAVLVLNLGGVHRLLDFGAATTGAARAAASERVMPGGEILFNSNQVRCGPRNRTQIAQAIATLDDLGYDGNQGSVFRSDALLANTILAANSLRSTDNRWREAAREARFSLLSRAFSNDAATAAAMNTCAHNQGDHCIVALGAAPLGVVDQGNLERNASECSRLATNPGAKAAAISSGVSAAWTAQNAGRLDTAQSAQLSRGAMTGSLDSVARLQAGYQTLNLAEAQRVAATDGADDPRVAVATTRAQGNAQLLRELRSHGELAGVAPAVVPADGAVLDGRVSDAALLGHAGLRVQAVNAEGRALGPEATTDANGYYAMSLDSATTQTLARERQVFVQVSDEQGRVLQRVAQTGTPAAGSRLRTELLVTRATVASSDAVVAPVIYQRGVPGAPGGGSTPLEDIKGFGPVMAGRLREAGIADVEALLRTDTARLVEIFGFDADVPARPAPVDDRPTPTPAPAPTPAPGPTPSPLAPDPITPVDDDAPRPAPRPTGGARVRRKKPKPS